MDVIDKQLVQLLEKDASQNSKILAAQLDVSAATVRRRIAKLVKNDVIRFVAVVDPEKAGFPFAAVLTLDIELAHLDSAVQYLDSRPEVRWLCTSTGRFNVVAVIQFASPSELANFTKKELAIVKGVKHIETSIILKREKAHYVLGVY